MVTGQGGSEADEGNLDELPEFRREFLWGVGTAGYQNEGGIENCDWHNFTNSPAIKRRVAKLTSFALGREVQLEPAGEAVRHRDLLVLREDLERARFLGMNCYRFSLEWSRLQPRKPNVEDPTTEAFNTDAACYYDAVLDLLDEFTMVPVVTLNHLTLPLWVLDPPRESGISSLIGLPIAVDDDDFRGSLGGWESAETVRAFIRFVAQAAERYRDRVRYWITLNEPVGSMIGVGYIGGVWSPGFSLAGDRAKSAYFNLLRAHVGAFDAIKAAYGDRPSYVGIAHAMLSTKSSGASPVATGAGIGAAIGAVIGGVVGFVVAGPAGAWGGAAGGATLGATIGAIAGGAGNINEAARNQFDYFYNDHILESLMSGQVDIEIHRRPDRRRNVDASTFYELSAAMEWSPRLDFIGINYYRSVYPYYDQIIAMTAGYTGGAFENDLRSSGRDHQLINDLGWEICPVGLYRVVDRVRRFERPILITENGIPQTADRNRAPHIVSHLQQLLRTARDGLSILGYIHWTIVDNFEWQEHYTDEARFGLFTRDHPEQIRRITEGAFALRYIALDGRIGQVLERYGTISPNGQRVQLPSLSSGSMWVGRGAPEDFRLFLSRLSSGSLDGCVFFPDRRRWISVADLAWSEPDRRLSFSISHPDGWAQSFEGTLDGVEFNGNWFGPERQGNWVATRLAPFGLWRKTRGGVPFDALMFSSFEDINRWNGKWIMESQAAEWRALEFVQWEDDRMNFWIGNFEYTAAVDGDTMSGIFRWRRIGSRPSESEWSAVRASAGLPF